MLIITYNNKGIGRPYDACAYKLLLKFNKDKFSLFKRHLIQSW